jgi:lipoprotein-anchoring transpeptidase ErfK/SrfK
MNNRRKLLNCAATAAVIGGWTLASSASLADPLAWRDPGAASGVMFEQLLLRDHPSTQSTEPADEVPGRLKRQTVNYATGEAPGTIVVDTPNTYLYFVLPGGKAVRYGIGVGRAGFTWSGTETVAQKAEWPDWTPPAEMIARQPYLPRWVAGGPSNPLGARALYLGGTAYRIHGTNQPSTIGGHVSSGCIRMVNEDVTDLYDRVHVGTKVVVLPMGSHAAAKVSTSRQPAPPSRSAAAPIGPGTSGLY